MYRHAITKLVFKWQLQKKRTEKKPILILLQRLTLPTTSIMKTLMQHYFTHDRFDKVLLNTRDRKTINEDRYGLIAQQDGMIVFSASYLRLSSKQQMLEA